MDYNKLIKELLIKRGCETDAEMENFLNPSLASFHNPFLLSNMKEAVERINIAIKNKEKIVIYGDYDCDGICAVSILYLFFKSQNSDVIGFIPSRHTDGYGLSEVTVKHIATNLKPNLLITVDTGISAYKEVELLKSLGIDVIVTDHHEPPAIIPNTIVIDPKLDGQVYPFNGLSGAGVAFKVVQAILGLDDALKFIDITAISTIGDIVPLLDENRAIVKFGLEQINSKNARPSISYLKSKLKTKTLSSTDIAFKVVPKLNACGRISTAEKCFKYMVEKNANELEKLYELIEADNNYRLELTTSSLKNIDLELEKIDLNSELAVFIKDEEINLGLIGIMASRLVGALNRPVFVVTCDEAGNLKASVRSVEGINIFNILDKHRHLLIDVGGHSLAGGLTVSKENYEALKQAVNNDLKQIDKSVFKINKNFEYEAKITPKDINMNLASQIEKLEPFGFMNPRPVFKLETISSTYEQMKSIKHYKILTSKNTEIISFFGDNLVPFFKSNSKKDLRITLEVDRFFSKPRAKAMLKCLDCSEYYVVDETEYNEAKEIYYLAQTLKTTNLKKYKNFEISNISRIDDFGSVLVTDNRKEAEELSKRYSLKIKQMLESSGESIILYNPHRVINQEDLKIYKKIYIFSGNNLANYLDNTNKEIFNIKVKEHTIKTKLTREIFKNAYILITKNLKLISNNLFEIVEYLTAKTNLSPSLIIATILVGEELGFYKINKTDDGLTEVSLVQNSEKKELILSELYNKLS